MLLKMIRFCLDAKQIFNEKVKAYDLTFSQWQVLKVINLSFNKELTINEIVEQLDSDKATISLIVKKLKSKDMLMTLTKEDDKRKVYLRLTDKMQKQCINLKKVEKEVIDEMFSNLNKEEIKTLNELVMKI